MTEGQTIRPPDRRVRPLPRQGDEMGDPGSLEEIRERWSPGTVVYQSETDEWLVHASRDIPFLLSEIDRLREEGKRLREAVAGIVSEAARLNVHQDPLIEVERWIGSVVKRGRVELAAKEDENGLAR